MEKSDIIFFFREEDYLSQWFYSPFKIDNIQFLCCEQWMMYSKAILFNDHQSATLILKEKSPGMHKEIGRSVKGFKKDIWNKNKQHIVYQGNLAKFSQNSELKNMLLSTKKMILAEANPNDTIWGIGLSESVAKNKYPNQWRGKNLLGKILMKVREKLA